MEGGQHGVERLNEHEVIEIQTNCQIRHEERRKSPGAVVGTCELIHEMVAQIG